MGDPIIDLFTNIPFAFRLFEIAPWLPATGHYQLLHFSQVGKIRLPVGNLRDTYPDFRLPRSSYTDINVAPPR